MRGRHGQQAGHGVEWQIARRRGRPKVLGSILGVGEETRKAKQ